MSTHDQKEIIQFASIGDVPRTFLIKNENDVIDVIDVDNDKVICRDLMRERKSVSKVVAVMMLSESSWKEFSYFISKRPEYVGGIEDIESGMDVPQNGKTGAYAKYGVREDDGVDIRPEGTRNGEKITRGQAIKKIMAHETHHVGNGSSMISWNVKINELWDLSGKPVNGEGEDVSEEFDEAWSDLIERNEVLVQAKEAVLAPYLKDKALFLSKDGNSLMMNAVLDEDMSFTSMSELKEKLDGLTDAALYRTYVKCAKLDNELSDSNLKLSVQVILNEIRTEMETELRDGPEEISIY